MVQRRASASSEARVRRRKTVDGSELRAEPSAPPWSESRDALGGVGAVDISGDESEGKHLRRRSSLERRSSKAEDIDLSRLFPKGFDHLVGISAASRNSRYKKDLAELFAPVAPKTREHSKAFLSFLEVDNAA